MKDTLEMKGETDSSTTAKQLDSFETDLLRTKWLTKDTRGVVRVRRCTRGSDYRNVAFH